LKGILLRTLPLEEDDRPLGAASGSSGLLGYGASDGMGLLEFMEWCEDLGIQPVLAVYAGYSLKGEHVDPGAGLQPFVDDALDEIEYVTGGPSTKWGFERAKDGHPAPFRLAYVEIGNEDQFDRSHSYNRRFAQFYEAIKKKYPGLLCIATTCEKGIPWKPDVIDEHYYRNAWEMEGDATHYDAYDRERSKSLCGRMGYARGRTDNQS